MLRSRCSRSRDFRTNATILLLGETGCGKSALAEATHQRSRRAKAPFVVVDCGALPTNLLDSELFGHEKGAFTGAHSRRIGAFEEAHSGTVFLDEIGELPPELQTKLLRVLETKCIRRVGSNTSREVDVRIIAATNRNLEAEVASGRVRADLFYRLAVVVVEVPPLRSRREDILPIAARILHRLGHGPRQIDALLMARVEAVC